MAEASPYGMSFDERLALLAMKPVIDVQVCGHCNLRCAGCMHFAPLAEVTFLDLDEYENDLTRFSSIEDVSSYFDAIVLMGGEPLLHPQIVEIIRMTRRHLPKILLALCTNGLLLKRMGEDFWSALIECEVDLTISPYPIHLDYNALIDFVQAKGAQARFNQDITGMCVGREMFMRLALDSDGECNPTESFVSCPFGGHFLQLSHGAIWPCQVTAHHDYFSKRFGYDMHDGPEDSLPLECIASMKTSKHFVASRIRCAAFATTNPSRSCHGSVRSSQKTNGSHRGGPDNQACAHHSCSMFDQLDATRETGQFSSVMSEDSQKSE